jgi:hypothetical protein
VFLSEDAVSDPEKPYNGMGGFFCLIMNVMGFGRKQSLTDLGRYYGTCVE